MAKAVLAEESKTKPGTRVFQAEATDADSNAALEYQFTPGLEASMTERFYISPTSVSLFDSLFYRKQYHPTNFLIFESSTQWTVCQWKRNHWDYFIFWLTGSIGLQKTNGAIHPSYGYIKRQIILNVPN